MESRIKGVIFDLDGTLIDSEENYYESDKILLSGFGIGFTQEDKKKYVGTGNMSMMQDIKKRYGLADSAEDLLKKKNDIYLGIALKKTRVFPEMMRFLRLLREDGYSTAVASGSSPVILSKLLAKLDLESCFDAVVSSEDVERGKPEPDIFLEAAKRLGLGPESSAVVEDSVYGVMAAIRASMACIAVPYFTEKPLQESFLKADLLFENGIKEFDAEKAFKWVKGKLN
jgi:HAD superfamily hydrolase (TIGR01509 family)